MGELEATLQNNFLFARHPGAISSWDVLMSSHQSRAEQITLESFNPECDQFVQASFPGLFLLVRDSIHVRLQREHFGSVFLHSHQWAISCPELGICRITIRDGSFSSVTIKNLWDGVPAVLPEPPTKLFNGPMA